MKRQRVSIGRAEKTIGWVILTLLLAITIVFLHIQRRMNPAIYPVSPGLFDATDVKPGAASAASAIPVPEGMTPFGEIESFTPDTLSNKINGKAELYLSSGFVQLTSRRLRPKGDADTWTEIYLYDMGTPRNAWSVFSTQRREGAEPVSLKGVTEAYGTENALFMAVGKHYLEIVASRVSENTRPILSKIAKALIPQKVNTLAGVSDRALFPGTGLVPDSIELVSRNVFGFDRLDNVFIARYRFGNEEVTAFLSRRKSPEAAHLLAKAYREFLHDFGGKAISSTKRFPDDPPVEIMGTLELFFAHGPFFAGVHEAENLDVAEKAAASLKAQLEKGTDGFQ